MEKPFFHKKKAVLKKGLLFLKESYTISEAFRQNVKIS